MGDELMAAGDAEALFRKAGKRVKILDKNGRPRWHALWEGNPAIAMPEETGDFASIVNGSSCRPYHVRHTDRQWFYNFSYRPNSATIQFTDEELAFGAKVTGKIVIEPNIKQNASPNKQWGQERWRKLASLLAKDGHRLAQLGESGARPIPEVEFVASPSFRHAAAALKFAKGAFLPEGGLHHAAAAVGLPAVVIFGGFTPIELTGYSLHKNIGVSGKDACGLRVPCDHCAKIMSSITPEFVFEQGRRFLND